MATPRFSCTYFGAEKHSKKRSLLAQNLENKGLEFFLPSRSMVLKVVTGKIFKALELSRIPAVLLWSTGDLNGGLVFVVTVGFSPLEAPVMSGCQRT
jgi:hypothetical protein